MKKATNLTTLILAGLVLGIILGLLLGERASVLEPIGTAFVRLLQMAVLPYFLVALLLGFGRLSFEQAKGVGIRLLGFSLILWGLTILLVFILPLAFPDLKSASFFSSSMVQTAAEVDFVSLYVPANPFESLSEAVIPGVVVFGIAMGLALIGVPEKKVLLTVLESVADALGRVTGFVVKLTPIGVFALAAGATGSMSPEDFSRLQVYLVAYTLGAVLLTFWLVPMLVSSLTPFGFREILRATRDPLVTGFTTGNLLVVLAMLAENCKGLFARQQKERRQHAESVIDVSLPIAFTFPNLGVVLILLFIPFAGWFTGSPIEAAQYPRIAVLGFFSFFGSVEMGLPFLLRQLRIPTDLFQLHLVTLVYIGRAATLVAVMHLAAVALLTAAGNARLLHFKPKRFGLFAVASLLIVAASLSGAGLLLSRTVDQSYSKDQMLTAMAPLFGPAPEKVSREVPASREGASDSGVLEEIRRRGVLRVGYDPGGLPFSFFNEREELVGIDIEMTQALGDELGVGVEYFPYDKRTMSTDLNETDRYDLLVGGLFATTRRVESMRFSDPYLDLNLAFVVRDHRRQEFSTVASLRGRSNLRIGVLEQPYFGTRIEQGLPGVTTVLLDSPEQFFEAEEPLDALVMSAEAGSAWTLLHPHFNVVIPDDVRMEIPVGFPMPARALHLENVVSRWLDLKRKDGTIEALHAHWIEGRTEARTEAN